MMKRMISVVLSAAVAFVITGFVPTFEQKAYAATSGIYTYEVSGGKATITDCDESVSGVITIPSKLGGHPVTSIGLGAFGFCYGLTNVIIPNSVTNIESHAFFECGIASITIPDSVTNIGVGAFSFCMNLASVIIPSSVISISHSAFYNCSSLTNINVNSGNQYYLSQNGVLFNKNKSTLIQYPLGNPRSAYMIPNGVISIEEGAFRNCQILTSVSIPNSVTSIGWGVFENCSELISVNIPSSITSIGACAFADCTKLTAVTIPSSVTNIGDYAFHVYTGVGYRPLNLTIYGAKGTYAETYANNNGIRFVAFGGVSPTPHLEQWNHDPNTYNREIAEKSSEYAMLAYEAYHNLNNEYTDASSGNIDKNGNKTIFKTPEILKRRLAADKFEIIKDYNYSDKDAEGEQNVSFVLARKKVLHNGVPRNLTVVIIRGTDGVEWRGNMDVTGFEYDENQTDHFSFRSAAIDVRSRLADYLKNDVNSLVWITGHSRGAAVANLLAYVLSNSNTVLYDKNGIFCYTFATPNNTKEPNTTQPNIFNFIFNDDFVPQVPLKGYDWKYGKHGRTFTATAQDLYKSNPDFKTEMKAFIKRSYGYSHPDFDYNATHSLIKYVGGKWNSVDKYYNKFKQEGSYTLYSFFREVVADAANGDALAAVELASYALNMNFGKISNFFIGGNGRKMYDPLFNGNINDTHQAFTYYCALKNNGFSIPSDGNGGGGGFSGFSSGAFSIKSTAMLLEAEIPESPIQAEITALTTFANTDNNLALLGWDISDISTWSYITWDGNSVSAIDLGYLDLSGSLDLSSFSNLQDVSLAGNLLTGLNLANCAQLSLLDVSSNALESLDLTGCANLSSLECSFNKLGTLDVSDCITLEQLYCNNNSLESLDISQNPLLTDLYCNGNNLKTLDITTNTALLNVNTSDNYFDEEESSAFMTSMAVIEEREGTWVKKLPQRLPEAPVFGESDIAKLTAFANQNDNLEKLGWDLSDPQTWPGAEWEKVNGEYFLSGLNIVGADVSGDLVLSDMPSLKSISCDHSGLSSVSVSGCGNLSFLSCRNSNIQSIDITNTPTLEALYCDNNYITDLSAVIALEAQEGTIVTYDNQAILADISEFNEIDYNALCEIANTYGKGIIPALKRMVVVLHTVTLAPTVNLILRTPAEPQHLVPVFFYKEKNI